MVVFSSLVRVKQRLPSVCRLPQPHDTVGRARVAVSSLGLDPDAAPLWLRLQMDLVKALLRRSAGLTAGADGTELESRDASWTARLTDFSMTAVVFA